MFLAAACASQGSSQRPDSAAKPVQAGSGPAPAAAAQPAEAPADGRIVCQMERPTGSNIPERVCRWQPAVDSERMQTQDDLRNLPRGQMKSGR